MSKPPQSQQTDEDIQNPKFAASALDFLLIELVPLAQRITQQAQAREQVLIDEYRRSKIFNSSKTETGEVSLQNGTQATTAADGSAVKGPAQGENTTSLGFTAVGEDTREAMFWRLDGLGYRVGQGLVER